MFPQLSPALTSLGFREVEREPLLICTPEMLRPARNAPDLTVATLTRESPLRDIQQELDINERGFDPGFSGSATAEQAERFRSTLDSTRAFTAYLNGEAVAAGMFHTPLGGVTQLSGIATLAAFRERGIATALTTFITQSAFDAGVDLVYLAAATGTAQRVYERIGYRQAGTLIRYDDTLTNVPPSND
jgi:predicted GNAT family acetyltransferase